MVNDIINRRNLAKNDSYLKLLVFYDNGQQQLDSLVKDLQLPIDIIALLYKHSDLFLNIDDDIIGLVFGKRRERW